MTTQEHGRVALSVERRLSDGRNPLDLIEWQMVDARAHRTGDDQKDLIKVEAPSSWSQMAINIAASKYLKRSASINEGAGETSIRALIERVVDTISNQGVKQGYFDDETRGIFRDELCHILIHQMGAFNSPVYFNCGLMEAYGLSGTNVTNHFWDAKAGKPAETQDYYGHPQLAACFIQSIKDDLQDIWEHVGREMKIYKGGSGSGSNFSTLRSEGEALSSGGTSSGVISFLEIFDKAAGSTKSGGTSRRAAKMVILNADHPEVMDFIRWKAREEEKAKMLIAAGLPSDFNGEAYHTVSGQNSNNTVRLTDEFMESLMRGGTWDLKAVTTGEVVRTVKAEDLFREICDAAWQCADPGLQFDTTINSWHTCPKSGRINASNPCFTGDTRIATPQGLIRISDLCESAFNEGEMSSVFTTEGMISVPAAFMVTGHNRILGIHTSDGRLLKVTPQHTCYADGKKIKAEDLKPGMSFDLLSEMNTDSYVGEKCIPTDVTLESCREKHGRRSGFSKLPKEWTPEFSEIIGHLIADGFISGTSGDSPSASIAGWVFGTHPDEQDILCGKYQRWFEDHLEDIPVHIHNVGSGCRQIRIVRRAFVSMLEDLGVKRFKAHNKRVPEGIFRAPKHIIAAFLRGYFGGDGTVGGREDEGGAQVSCASASIDLLRDVQQLLDLLGIRSRIKIFREEHIISSPRSEFDGYVSKKCYRLCIDTRDIQGFADGVGFSVNYKNEKLSNLLLARRTIKSRREFEIVTITEIEEMGEELTYNLTEPINNLVWANGILCSQCSEVHFLDDVACNLSSANLVKFLLPDGSFDVATFKYVCRILTIAQDIIVDYSAYPTEMICRNSHNFRPLGLGYTNLGAMLMRMAIPYDSDRGRAIASTISAILTAASYGTSAEIAEVMGPFAAFKQNKTPMLAVISKHARKATNPTYEKMCPEYLMDAAAEMWEEVVTLGKKFGFRNAQTTCAAPTGTISFMMDCDTTGIEPEFALVKEKMYSGGGADKIVNQSVEPALVGLGYTSDQVRDIITHINGSGQIKKIGEVGVCEKRLISLGFDEETLSKVNKKVKSSRTLGDAFSNIPEAVAIVQEVQDRFDIDAENGVDPLERMGFSSDEIDAANLYSCGHMGIETAPHLRAEHIPIFDCAAMCGIDGTRLIHPQGHIKMMAAIQPFLSAGISKTVNLPFDATSQDIWDIFVSAWQQGLKCITIYRDGCKGSQPLTASGRAGEEDTSPLVIRRRKPPTLMTTGKRRKLTMNGYTIYVHAYHDEDTGKINEIWIDTKPGGGILDGFLNAIAKLVSTALQYGIPMEEIIQKFAYSSFDPSGNVTHPKIKKCKSLLDLVFRTIAVDFLGDDTYADNPEAEMMPSPQPVAQQEISGSRHHEIIICIQCGSDQVLKTGTCYTCPICGTTTGCA